jgi:hypothetical protein
MIENENHKIRKLLFVIPKPHKRCMKKSNKVKGGEGLNCIDRFLNLFFLSLKRIKIIIFLWIDIFREVVLTLSPHNILHPFISGVFVIREI